MIITPDTSVNLDHYFVKQEIDTDSLFAATVETNEDIQQDVDKRQEFDLDMMFMTEKARQQMGDMLHAPDKVKQLYEEKETVARDDNSSNDTFLVVDDHSKDVNDGKTADVDGVEYETDVSCEELDMETITNTSQEFHLEDLEDDKPIAQKLVVTEFNDQVNEFKEERCENIKEIGGSGITKYNETSKDIDEGQVKKSDRTEKDISDQEMKKVDDDDQSELEHISNFEKYDQEMKQVDDDNCHKLEDNLSLETTGSKHISKSASPVSNESCERKTPFLGLPEVDQFLELTDTVPKSEKKKMRQNSFKKNSKISNKQLRTYSYSEFPMAILITRKFLTERNRPNRSKSDIAKELKLFSAQILLTEKLKRQKLLYSRISLPPKFQADKDVHVMKKEKGKQMHSLHKSPKTNQRYRSISRASEYESNRSQTCVSVTDIGFGLR
jgi:hypothetical protein